VFRKILLVAAGSLVLVSAPSVAQSVRDVRCLVLGNGFARGGSTEPAKLAGQMAAHFYLGRVDGRWNDAKLRAAIIQQQKTIVPAKAGAELQACMGQIAVSAKKLEAISRQPAPKPK
jgi:hypothetical protein